MANRQQDYRQHLQGWPRQEQGRQREERFSRDDEDRDYSQGFGQRDYGQYANTDEGESSVRAGGYDEGRTRFGRWRDTREESGSTGRSAGYGDFGQGDYDRPGRYPNTGQDRYGQTGYGQGGYGQGNYGQPNYGSDYGYGYGRAGRRDFYGAGRGTGGVGSRFRESRFGYGGSGSGYSSGDWQEPYGEGQQYGQQYGWQTGEGQQYGRFGEGTHRGKGPKGYQRSDERLKEMICERLRDDPDIDASEVTVTVMSGKITLDGSVDNRRTKNAIEDVADQLGVQEVQNNLRIQRLGQQGSEQGRSGQGSMSKSTLSNEDEDQKKQKRN